MTKKIMGNEKVFKALNGTREQQLLLWIDFSKMILCEDEDLLSKREKELREHAKKLLEKEVQ